MFLRRTGSSCSMLVCTLKRTLSPIRTLELRSFLHQFRETETPESYYKYMRGEISRRELFQQHPLEAKEAKKRCLQAELGNTELYQQINNNISSAIAGKGKWVLVGGPPCQAYSTIGRSKNNSLDNYDPEEDVRFDLYLEYLKIISTHWPAVFVMENVKGLLSASRRNVLIFSQMHRDLADPIRAVSSNIPANGKRHKYSLYPVTVRNPSLGGIGGPIDPTEYVVKSEEFGIPQARHRVVILGVRDDILKQPTPLIPQPSLIYAGRVLEGLACVRSGLSTNDSPEEWLLSVNEITNQDWWGDVSPIVQSRITEALEGLREPLCGRGQRRFLEGVCGLRIQA